VAEEQHADPVSVSSDDALEQTPTPRPFADAIAAGAAGPTPEALEQAGIAPAKVSYRAKRKAELVELATVRGLDSSGTVDELVDRLEADDNKAPAGDGG
jgi:hypothetical protein